MSSSALRAAWEAAQTQTPAKVSASADDPLRVAWEKAQQPPADLPREQAIYGKSKIPTEPRPSGGLTGVARVATAHALNAAQGLPGVEAAEAGLMWLGSKMTGQPMDYRESLATLRNEISRIPAPFRIAEQVAFGGRYLPQIAKSAGLKTPGKQGAALGGLSQLLSANPDESITARTLKTAGGASIGGLLGRALDFGTTAGKALFAKNPATNIIERQAERAASAKQLYDAAAAEGNATAATPAIQKYLAEPDIAQRVATLRQLDQFKNVAPDDPRMLDAIYKSLSDEAKTLQKGLAVAEPGKPNVGRFKLEDVKGQRQRLLGAMEQPTTQVVTPTTAQAPPPSLRDALRAHQARPGIAAARREGTVPQQKAREALERHSAEAVASPPLTGEPVSYSVETGPGMMPSYREAVEDFARRTAEINAVGKGMTASQATTNGRPSFRAIMSKEPKTPQTFAEWAKTADPGEVRAAREGVLGDVSNAFHEKGKTLAPFRRATSKGSALLRSAPNKDQELTDLMQMLGLTAINANPFGDR